MWLIDRQVIPRHACDVITIGSDGFVPPNMYKLFFDNVCSNGDSLLPNPAILSPITSSSCETIVMRYW